MDKKFLIYIFIMLTTIFLISYSTGLFTVNEKAQAPGALGLETIPENRSLFSGDTDKVFFVRTYKWQLIPEKNIITRLKLPIKDVKNEIKIFGVNLKMKHPAYVTKRGFTFIRGKLSINYKSVFKKSSPSFTTLSPDLIKSANIKKDEDPLLCFLKFVQSIKYKIPPKFYKGKYIMEFFTPLICLYENYGDCDSKSILLANFLYGRSFKNEKMVLVILKGFGIFHAILAIKRIPLPGMLSFYINNKGPFIPLETTRQGWMPGFSDRRVLLCLKNGDFRFSKLF